MLAVNTAGMLVRRRVLDELDGFDDELPMFGNDLDFGWRAAAAGYRTVVVPQAVVFHAEAAHRGVRQTPLTGRHTHYQERRAALFTLLANGRARRLPLQVVRLTFGTFLRMIGYLLVRSPGEALDDLAALVSVLPTSAATDGRAPGPAGRRDRGPRRRSARSCRRGGCPTGTGWTSSATSAARWASRPPTSPTGAGPPRPSRTRSRSPRVVRSGWSASTRTS